MPRYTVAIVAELIFTLNTAKDEDIFATNKDELVDKLDPGDEKAIAEWLGDLEIDELLQTFLVDTTYQKVKVVLQK